MEYSHLGCINRKPYSVCVFFKEDIQNGLRKHNQQGTDGGGTVGKLLQICTSKNWNGM